MTVPEPAHGEPAMNDLFPVNSDVSLDASAFYLVKMEGQGYPAFELAVPVRASSQPDNGMLCLGSGDPRDLKLRVSVRRLVRELHAFDLVAGQLEASGHHIIETRLIDNDGHLDVDVLTRLPGGSTMRLRTVSDGEWLFEVSAEAAHDHFQRIAHEAFFCLASFRIRNPSCIVWAEQHMEWQGAGQFLTSFKYPASWNLTERVQNADLVAAKLTSEYEGSQTGQIRLEVHQRASERDSLDLLRSYSNSLKNSGMHLTGAPIVPVSPLNGFDRAWMYSPTGMFDGNRFDAPVLMVENSDVTVLIGLVGTSREHSPEWWAINKCAFEIVRDSLTIRSNAGKDRVSGLSGVPN